MINFGIDIGSVAVKLIVMDTGNKIIESRYLRHHGNPVKVTRDILEHLIDSYKEISLSLTGSGSRFISEIFHITPVNEVIAISKATAQLYPHIRTVIEIGGEDSKLLFLDERGRIKDFSTNSICAAGTGSFIEQQCERLEISIDEFSELSLRSKKPARIAGRCSVFAKSDMIHLQQIATPIEDIISGLCYAVARNFKATIIKNEEITSPVAFYGGVASNRGVVKAFRDILGIDDIFIPEEYLYMGAIGAILKDMDERRIRPTDEDEILKSLMEENTSQKSKSIYPPLDEEGCLEVLQSYEINMTVPSLKEGIIDGYLGIDIGSISTNLAVIDDDGNLIVKKYLMTSGRPIEAVRKGLMEIYQKFGERLRIKAVGTTGSGRYMIADYVGADIVKNEITAQYTAAVHIDPSVDTIFEIGGQDSKYISIKDGIIVDFEMNKACAAGTGSFLEEQAEKLGISIKSEFQKLACSSKCPANLGERCTVFMENSLMASIGKGAEKNDILAGLAYSIVENYINRVVCGKPVGERIFFQGGVAFNRAVVRAFERYLEKKITVPPHHEVTGAIGMALIARSLAKERNDFRTSFKGFDLVKREYTMDSFTCNGCPNICEINKVKVEGEENFLFYGGRCERYDIRQSKRFDKPDLFDMRKELLWKEHIERNKEINPNSPRIGIPYIFFMHEYLPFWSTLFNELGFHVIVSPPTNREIINLGTEMASSDACFPVKVSLGHIRHLIMNNIDSIFLPSFINLNKEDNDYERGVTCPHVQSIPYTSMALIKELESYHIIRPVIDFSKGKGFLLNECYKYLRKYGISKKRLIDALISAKESQNRFLESYIKERRILDEINGPVFVIIGRSYNSTERGLNLDIPKKISRLGFITLPMDILPLEDIKIKERWPNMYWRAGQRILKSARFIRSHPDLYAIYIGNFSCGPDSFILKYFEEEMKGKPFLQLEIDEHTADAGIITRCEAFIDSIMEERKKSFLDKKFTIMKPDMDKIPLRDRRIYIPRMSDHAYGLKAAFHRCGIDAEVMPESDLESIRIAKRYISGRECYPCHVTTGDMLKVVFSKDFVPEKTAFFMPSGIGPCRFGQYNVFHKLLLTKLGIDAPVYSPTQDENFYRELGTAGKRFTEIAWKGIVAYEILLKTLHETRPYEKSKGESDELYNEYMNKIYHALLAKDSGLEKVLHEMKKDFMNVERYKDKKPLVGIIGEIFVRSNRFSNEDLIRKIESMGGEAWLSPVEEWLYYINYLSKRKAWIKKRFSTYMQISLKRFLQKRLEHRLHSIFKDSLRTLKEPDTKEILKNASPYIHDSFEGEAILSIGRALDFIKNGASGIINAMPFGCMPGTIVTTIMKRIQKEYEIPFISIPYDGTDSITNTLQSEAFMEQIRSRR